MPAIMSPCSITLETAEQVVEQLTQKHHSATYRLLRDLQRAAKAKRQCIREWCILVHLLDVQYQHRAYVASQLVNHWVTRLEELDHSMATAKRHQHDAEGKLAQSIQTLQQLRRLIHTREGKKRKRQKQYHRVHVVPIVALWCKRRYINARDRHSQVEHQVAEKRMLIEHCQATCRSTAKVVMATREEQQQAQWQLETVEQQLAKVKHVVTNLREGQQFWVSFDSNQVQLVLETSRRIMQSMRQDPSIWTKPFKMACFEFETCNAYAMERWGNLDVEFDCAICRKTCLGWPRLFKDETTNTTCLVCVTCHPAPFGCVASNRVALLEKKNMSSSSWTTAHTRLGKLLTKLKPYIIKWVFATKHKSVRQCDMSTHCGSDDKHCR